MERIGVILLFVLFFVAVALGGCVGPQDPINVVKADSRVKEFLAENPDAAITSSLWEKSQVKSQINTIMEKCGRQFEEKPHLYFLIKKNENQLEAWLDEKGTEVLCVYKKPVTLDECQKNSDCDDGASCTSDVCSGAPKKCSHSQIINCNSGDGCCPSNCSHLNDSDCTTLTCAAQSGRICSSNETCPSNFISAFDSDRCCPSDCEEGTPDPCKNVTCDPNKKCVSGGCVLKTCDEMGGTLCPSNKVCSRSVVLATGTTQCCLGECINPIECYNDSQCNDQNACTVDICDTNNACLHTPITRCQNGDGCCPADCNYFVDNDCSPPACPVPGTICYYVSASGNDNGLGTIDSPFKTLEKARDAVRGLKQQNRFNAPVNVYVRGGVYRLDKTFNLTFEDSGASDKPITYQAYPGEEVVISGGKKLKLDWKPYKGGIYVADVSSFLGQYGDFNSLFVDGKRAVRAREPDEGFYYINGVDAGTNLTAFNFSGSDISAKWTNLNDVEVISYRRWKESRFKIARVEGQKVYFVGSLPIDRGYDYDYNPSTGRYYVENVFEGLDSPGEWYLDKHAGKLYYWPLPGKKVDSSEIVAPILNQLVKVNGEENGLNLAGSFTISHWVNTASTSIRMYTVGNAGAGNGYRFGLSRGKIKFLIGDGSKYTETICGNTIVSDAQWHLITGVFDRENKESKKFICYIDGEYEGEVPIDFYPNMKLDSPEIGKPPYCDGFVGAMDELRIFNRSLSQSEVEELFNAKDITNGLILHVPFEGSLNDVSGNFKNITLVGKQQFVEGKIGKALRFDVDTRLVLTFAENINFKGLTFADSDWWLPANGYYGIQTGFNIPVPAAVSFEFCRNCKFENNVIKNTGAYALYSYSENLQIIGNDIFDTGAGGIKVGIDVNENLTKNNTISNNRIHNTNAVYKEGAGILVLMSGGNKISHNLVYDTTYTGISVGWRWYAYDTLVSNNIIEYNEVHHVMQELNDGAAIYLVGKQPGTIVRNNICHDIVKTNKHLTDWGIVGIYLDMGSKDIQVKNNVVYRASWGALLLVRNFDNVVENNIFAEGGLSQLNYAGGSPDLEDIVDPFTNRMPSGNRFTRNIVYYENDGKLITKQEIHSIDYSNFNLYYNPNYRTNPNWNLEEWKQKGFDQDPIVADPLFEDYSNDKFTLLANSPALKPISQGGIGFQQIDFSSVGPIP